MAVACLNMETYRNDYLTASLTDRVNEEHPATDSGHRVFFVVARDGEYGGTLYFFAV
jgi:hypothetical protein